MSCTTCHHRASVGFFFSPQVLQEETSIPGSDLHLVYLSSRAAGYKPILKVTMTQSSIPFNLMKVTKPRPSVSRSAWDSSPHPTSSSCPGAVSGSPDGGSGGPPLPEVVPSSAQPVLYLHLGQDGRLRPASLRPVRGCRWVFFILFERKIKERLPAWFCFTCKAESPPLLESSAFSHSESHHQAFHSRLKYDL